MSVDRECLMRVARVWWWKGEGVWGECRC